MSDPKKIPPTLEEVSDFFAMLSSAVDPGRFFDYYESNGWKVGRSKMKDWQATARNWNRTTNMKTLDRAPAKPLSEWEIRSKQDRIKELRESQRLICYPGGSAYPVTLTPEKGARVKALQAQIDQLKKELGR